jgi:hypothetical protein
MPQVIRAQAAGIDGAQVYALAGDRLAHLR